MAKLGNEKISWIVSVVSCFFLSLVLAMATTSNEGSGKELEFEKLLKKLNKPAVKSIKSPDGDIIDCVPILNQPVFDNPKLKNHKIQLRPTFYPKRSNVSKSNPIAQMWHQSGSCPKGTVPIRRTTKEDILRADSIKEFSIRRSLYSTEGHEYAVADLRGDRYYGAHASINIWKPSVQESNEFSLSQIWILNRDDPNNVESIEAGWQISQQIYGDYNPRLFVFWTRDSYRNIRCYNLNCQPGFVQVDKKVAVRSSLQPSKYGGSQNVLSMLIRKDPSSGNWWMQVGNTYVGYWPGSLFSRMSTGASNVQWGGEIVNLRSNGQHTTTDMGSGYFPQEGYGKASFFKELSIVDANNNLVSPKNFGLIVTNRNCYDITSYAYSNDLGVYFYYGGPGRNPNCP
ncbi:uncharacterized protein LOC129312592 isoform X1 [Prosopis cineraria]|uniref:uncharacterized protein LOC129312592 isoform X1 n=1 Tax=Prosopis cineraria TaxID=364024 RepID=UPI00240F62E0|nr:uncharacterized protein LOC129312592 isoform X1 [Prosopis cineraria]